MSVNARTFQILYIIHELRDDQETDATHISAFIGARRKDVPALYSMAYISPNALRAILQRMTSEGLLTVSHGKYDMTRRGSQMAGLLDGLDACSDNFIQRYKELVVLAVLQQQQRIKQRDIRLREISGIAHISLDSVRKGISDLIIRCKVIESQSGRVPVYNITAPPKVGIPPETTTDQCLAQALAEINDDDGTWAIKDAVKDAVTDAITDAITEQEPPTTQDVIDEGDKTDGERAPGPHDWASVSPSVREGHTQRARACGMTLDEYFSEISRQQEKVVRAALFGDANPVQA